MSTLSTKEYDARLKSPFTAMVSGPSGSGKTSLMKNLISKSQDVSSPPPVEIIYCYGVWQKAFEELEDKVRFHEGMIDIRREIPSDGKNRWLIVDDLMQELAGKDETDTLFTKFSHHMNVSVFYLVQNLFLKANRTISLNTHYFFLFKNPRDASVISRLSAQSFPGKARGMQEVFADATSTPFSFLLIDMKQKTQDDQRLVGNFASNTLSMNVYSLN